MSRGVPSWRCTRSTKEADCKHEDHLDTVTGQSKIQPRKKRSTNEKELIEAALNSESSHEATVVSVSDATIVVQPPPLPAGGYNIILYVDGQGNAMTNL